MKEIDAPEHNQPFGKRSRQSLTDMCAKKRARVSWTERDRNGRTLGRVWCSGIDANAEQVRRGMAWVFDRYVKDRSLYPRKTPRDPHGSACGPTWLPFRLGTGAKIRARSNTGRRSSAPTHRAMNTAEAKQKVIDALLAKFRDALDLELVEGLPAPVYDFNPNGWMLFRTRNAPGMLGGSEYVAVHRESGKVRFLGRLGD
ncbi:MAG TPA: thermonuclease family protein [Lacipirellulaceae bacterium]|nr:thermonuclease family protein [Lacipirellulaceae bacterium]